MAGAVLLVLGVYLIISVAQDTTDAPLWMKGFVGLSAVTLLVIGWLSLV